MANRAIRYRLYPNAEQKTFFAKTFGCCRKVYNLMLEDKIKGYESNGVFPSVTPAMYKKDYPFLREVDSLALSNVQMNLQAAFRNCFDKKRKKRNDFPKFKSAKRSRKSYTTNNQKGTVALMDRYIKPPKVGCVKAVLHRLPPEGWEIKSATISQEADDTYYVSVLFEYDEPTLDYEPDTNNAVGLDYKSNGLYTDSEGHCCSMPHFFRLSQKKLTKTQRRLKHKTVGSKNYCKQQKRIAKVYRHAANQRKDFLHKTSTAIAKRYDVVCVESLNMRAMSNKGFGNGKSTMDNGYGMFLDMLAYKLKDRNKYLIKVDKWFKSSQICHRCGTVHPEMKDLDIRTIRCSCGLIIDRDYNAAINIWSEGLRILRSK